MADEYVAYLEERVNELSLDNEKLVKQRNWIIEEMEKSGCVIISLPGMEPVVENIQVSDIKSKISKLLPETKINEIINGKNN